MTSSRGFSRYAPQMVAPAPSAEPANRSLLEIIRDLDGASSERLAGSALGAGATICGAYRLKPRLLVMTTP